MLEQVGHTYTLLRTRVHVQVLVRCPQVKMNFRHLQAPKLRVTEPNSWGTKHNGCTPTCPDK